MAGERTCPECGTKTDAPVCARDGFRTVLFEEEPEHDGVDPLVGTDFEGRFRVLELLGRGGYGAVYRANQLGIGRDVAIKLLHAKVGKNLKEIARFQQEARALAALKHPHIVDVYDFGQAADGTIYMVMEFLRGETLEDLIRVAGSLTSEETIGVALHIAEALAEAHHAGIVHRDLKPANIFLASGSRGRTTAKVLDFGIARVSGEAAAGITLTRAGAIIGSPPYMSPEQSRGDAVTASSDLYSLGCILYECLTGVRAFERESPTACLVAHCVEPPPPPARGGTPLTGPLVDLTLALLAKTPDERPASADAVIDALSTLGPNALHHEEDLPTGRQRLIFATGSTGMSGMGPRSADTLADTASDGLTAVGAAGRGAAAPRTLLWVALIVLLLGGCGAAAVLALGSSSEVPAADIAAGLDEAGSAEALAASPRAALAASPRAAPPREEVGAEGVPPEAALEGVELVGTEAEGASAVDEGAEGAAEPERLVVRLDASPRAQVTRGDEDLGQTPVELAWEAGEEPPTVTLSARGHRDVELTLSEDDAAAGAREVTLPRRPSASPVARPGTRKSDRDEADKPAVTGPTW